MDNMTPEQLAQVTSMGMAGLAIASIALVLIFSLVGFCLNLSLGIVGNRKPGVLRCVGWLIAIGFVNGFISSVLMSLLGNLGGLVALPVNTFSTAYMLSVAGDCSVFRGFLANILSGILSAVSVVILIFVIVLPLGLIGTNAEKGDGEIATMMNDFREAAEASRNAASTDGEGLDLGEQFNPVSSQPELTPEAKAESLLERFGFGTSESEPEPEEAKVPVPRKKPTPVKRAPDGSQLNPFFDG